MSAEISSNIVVIAINLIVGARLLKLGAARRAWPELLLGASLFFDGIEWLLWMLAFYTPFAGTPLADYLTAGCRAGILTSNLFMLLFVRTIFHPTRARALAFALAVSSTSWTGLIVGVSLGDWGGFASNGIWLWLELGGTATAYAWCVAEAVSYYAKIRKRTAHGLADPIVANRILLWSGYALANLMTEFVYMLAVALTDSEGSYPFFFDAIMIVMTTAGALLVLLAFFPPPTYLHWLSRQPSGSGQPVLETPTAP